MSIKIEKINSKLSNLNEENRISTATNVAILTRGLNKIKYERKSTLYKQLLEEAYGKTAGRVFEFIPVVISMEDLKNNFNITYSPKYQNLFKYSYVHNNKLYTNMRTLLKANFKYEFIPYNTEEELKEFLVIKMNIPMFVWSQLYTHTQLSKISESDRVSKVDIENFNCWIPDNFKTKFNEHFQEIFSEEEIIENLFNYLSQKELFTLFRDLGYPKEIYSRALYYFKYKSTIFAGWTNDPNQWDNLINERTNGWTQSITKEISQKIKTIYKGE